VNPELSSSSTDDAVVDRARCGGWRELRRRFRRLRVGVRAQHRHRGFDGSASLRLPLSESIPAIVAHFQWFHFDAGANPLNLVSTQRVQVRFVK
jgi:hypothetical protein